MKNKNLEDIVHKMRENDLDEYADQIESVSSDSISFMKHINSHDSMDEFYVNAGIIVGMIFEDVHVNVVGYYKDGYGEVYDDYDSVIENYEHAEVLKRIVENIEENGYQYMASHIRWLFDNPGKCIRGDTSSGLLHYEESLYFNAIGFVAGTMIYHEIGPQILGHSDFNPPEL